MTQKGLCLFRTVVITITCFLLELLRSLYSHGQELFYKFISKITNKLVKQLLSMTVHSFKRGNKTDDIGRNRLSVSHKSKRGTIMMRHKY